MKIGEARSTYNAYCNQLTDRYVSLRKQAEKATATGDTEAAGVILQLSQEVLAKRDEIQQFARFDIPELIYNMENEAMAPQQADAAKEYAKDMARLMEVARRIAAGDKVPSSDEKKLMEYDADLYQAVKAAALLAKMKEQKEYDSLWENEEEKDYKSMEEIDAEILETELDMELPEIDTSLLAE